MAVPNPERELGRLQQTLDRGLPPVTVLLGASGFFRAEAVDRVLGAVPAGAELRSVDGSQDSDGRELLDLRGAALFGSGSCLLVRRAEAWLKKRGADLEGVLAKMAPGCSLIVELTRLDRRTRLAKALAGKGAVFEFRDLYAEPYDRSRSPLEAELVGWVQQRGRAASLPLTAEAAWLVVTAVGTDPAELVAELARLAGGLAGRKRIGAEELRGQLTCSFESTPFELADAVLADDRRKASRSLAAIFARGVRGRDGAGVDRGGLFPFITSWLFRSMANAHEGRRLLDAGTPLGEVPAAVGVRGFTDRFREQVQAHTVERLAGGLSALVDSQRQLRFTGEDPQLVLERFLARWFAGGAA